MYQLTSSAGIMQMDWIKLRIHEGNSELSYAVAMRKSREISAVWFMPFDAFM